MGIGVGDDPRPRLDDGQVAFHDDAPDGDGKVGGAVDGEVADPAAVYPPLLPSKSSMISIARSLGAPERVPAGKIARAASKESHPSRSVPRTVVSMC